MTLRISLDERATLQAAADILERIEAEKRRTASLPERTLRDRELRAIERRRAGVLQAARLILLEVADGQEPYRKSRLDHP